MSKVLTTFSLLLVAISHWHSSTAFIVRKNNKVLFKQDKSLNLFLPTAHRTSQVDNTIEQTLTQKSVPASQWLPLGITAIATSLSFVPMALAVEDPELAELPPPYIPILVAVVLLGGVGLLTNSLGDVMAEEASLGNLSGAKAKKEMERSRSSYFKK